MKDLMTTNSSHTVPQTEKLLAALNDNATSSMGADTAIVSLRHSKKVEFNPDGSGELVVLGLLLSAAVLLYPSKVRAMLDAR